MGKILLSNMRIYAEDQIINNGYVLIEGEKIVEVGSQEKMTRTDFVEKIELHHKYSLIPGFIDLHIHGAAGADTMDATKEAIHTLAVSLPQEGTTSFLATTMTSTVQQIEKALINVRKYMETANDPGNAEVLGVHLEGPFISPKKAGAQHRGHILKPNLALFKKWQHLSGGAIKLVTLAPERKGGMELTSYLKQTGVVA
jgi:N-acetylglucosamine-6-phosphate deacetylase